MNTQLQWLSPSPLWQELSSASDLTAYRRPAILRFATDTFMQDLQSVLHTAPQTLRNCVAAAENWRTPSAGIDAAKGNTLPFKLFQPAHQRFYLIASSLTCRQPWLPDHTVNTSAGEGVAFVVRQVRPVGGYTIPNTGNYDTSQVTEYAWIPATAGVSPASSGASNSTAASSQNGASGASSTSNGGAPSSSGTQPGWLQTSSPTMLATGEELIPLSLTQFGSNGSSRRLYVGLIPASRRQQYISGRTLPTPASTGGSTSSGGATGGSSGSGTSGVSSAGSSSSGSSNGNGTSPDPRMDLFYREVIGPWCSLLEWAGPLPSPLPQGDNSPQEMSQMSSALILDDLGTFLSTYVPNVWNAMTGAAAVSSLNTAEAALYNNMGTTLQQAIVSAQANDQTFEQEGPGASKTWPPAGYSNVALTDASVSSIKPTKIQALVQNALPSLATVPAGVDVTPLPPLAQQPSDAPGNYYYIIRCVYLRPQCKCNIFSLPSQQFLLTNYFDSDAPARRIQVALPVDTSAAALRKYDKGIAFLISDELRNQMARVASLNDLANGQIGDSPGIGVGWICSFSIPIITICAFILLFCIVIALNLVFFWVPFFKICFPVPTLKGKS